MTKPEDFYTLEKPIVGLKEQIDALVLAGEPGFNEKAAALRLEIEAEWRKIQPGLIPSQIVQVATEAKARPSITAFTTMSAAMNIPPTDRLAGPAGACAIALAGRQAATPELARNPIVRSLPITPQIPFRFLRIIRNSLAISLQKPHVIATDSH